MNSHDLAILGLQLCQARVLLLQLSLAALLLLLLLLCVCQDGLQVAQLTVAALTRLHVSAIQQRQPRHTANHLQVSAQHHIEHQHSSNDTGSPDMTRESNACIEASRVNSQHAVLLKRKLPDFDPHTEPYVRATFAQRESAAAKGAMQHADHIMPRPCCCGVALQLHVRTS
jgi:hypothetical protein